MRLGAQRALSIVISTLAMCRNAVKLVTDPYLNSDPNYYDRTKVYISLIKKQRNVARVFHDRCCSPSMSYHRWSAPVNFCRCLSLHSVLACSGESHPPFCSNIQTMKQLYWFPLAKVSDCRFHQREAYNHCDEVPGALSFLWHLQARRRKYLMGSTKDRFSRGFFCDTNDGKAFKDIWDQKLKFLSAFSSDEFTRGRQHTKCSLRSQAISLTEKLFHKGVRFTHGN